jgi:RimJ/RimL family protein N-acetyltransferase
MALEEQFKQKLDLTPTGWESIPYPPEPFFETDRLIVRRYHLRDAPRLAEIANDKDVAENLSFPHPFTVDHAVDLITRSRTPDERGDTPALFCIVPKTGVVVTRGPPPDGVALVGGIGLTPDPHPHRAHNADLGYFLGRDYWGTGFVSEAGFEFLDRAFGAETFSGSVALQRVQTRVAASNEASVRLLVRLGFREEARMRGALMGEGGPVDELIEGLTRQEWERNKQESDEEDLPDDEEEVEPEEEDFDMEDDDEGDDEEFQPDMALMDSGHA